MSELYYDPWDVEIDLDPYPTYRRLRDEAPVYYNERHDFWGSAGTPTSMLRCGTRSGSARPRATSSRWSRPIQSCRRGCSSTRIRRCTPSTERWCRRAFMPKRMRALEDKIRAFCVACLDPLVGGRPLRLRPGSRRRAADAHHRHAGRHPRRRPAVGARPGACASCATSPASRCRSKKDHYFDGDMFTDYVAWRKKNPSDDLITELLNVEFEDETGATRRS